MSNTDKWGIFPLNIPNLVHPDDLRKVPKDWDSELAKTNRELPLVFRLLATDGEYGTFGDGSFVFRGKISAFKLVDSAPVFSIGDKVRVRQSGEEGIVRRLDWHFKRLEFIYFLLKNGRKSRAWHFADELTKAV